jgi:DNA polymerase III epsilon subunit-like protein
MFLVFDTETAGLPRDWSAPAADVHNWPRLVQIAWLCCDEADAEVASREYTIRPEGFVITRQASDVHGITTKRALAEGVDLQPVLKEFSEAVLSADMVVGHNVDFDTKVVGAELIRAGMANVFTGKTLRCTMRESTDYCRLPGKRGYKWPTLTELHETLFGGGFEGTHGALADARAAMLCFLKLRELRSIQ